MIIITIENAQNSEYDVEIKPIISISPILTKQPDVKILQIFKTILYSLMKPSYNQNFLIKYQRITNPLFLKQSKCTKKIVFSPGLVNHIFLICVNCYEFSNEYFWSEHNILKYHRYVKVRPSWKTIFSSLCLCVFFKPDQTLKRTLKLPYEAIQLIKQNWIYNTAIICNFISTNMDKQPRYISLTQFKALIGSITYSLVVEYILIKNQSLFTQIWKFIYFDLKMNFQLSNHSKMETQNKGTQFLESDCYFDLQLILINCS
ncbi:unnamed protein product [Paramecium octaurelia]|uniref:Uncharacterized protein n=1 Tax=Paramecium octaurelia TaxID=43137 RepID=A0A8S1XZJ3_PAROT|nr:unnamed protein product [Paramecium octaurelia]